MTAEVRVIHGDMREVLGKMIAEGKVVQAVVTDAPYHLTNRTPDVKWCADCQRVLGGSDGKPTQCPKCGGRLEYQRSAGGRGFMGKAWDGGDIAFQPGTWRLCFELLPPGGHLLAFAGTRTYHRMAVAIEEAGFEIRDTIAWLYGSGFPKSLNVSKAIDKAAGAEREVVGKRTDGRYGHDFSDKAKYALGRVVDEEGKAKGFVGEIGVITAPATDAARQWDGWGTALKPAMELICVARKPLVGTVAANVLKHGTGALNIAACRIAAADKTPAPVGHFVGSSIGPTGHNGERNGNADSLGRWPPNVAHDGSDEVVRAFPETGLSAGGGMKDLHKGKLFQGPTNPNITDACGFGDSGSAARFFYSARPDDEKRFHYSSKADADDRLKSVHPTIKPVDLVRWLVRLVTPPGGTVLDPFAGSGTTGMACMAEGIDCILIEREAEYVADIKARIAHVHGHDGDLFAPFQTEAP